MTISRQHRIQKISKRIAMLLTVGMILLPLLVANGWMTTEYVPTELQGTRINGYIRLSGMIASLPILIAIMFGLNALRTLFSLYGRGLMFDRTNVTAIRKFSLALIFYSFSSFLYQPIEGVMLGITGQARSISIGLSGEMILAFLTGAALLVISWVMDEARKIHDEQSLTV